MYRFVFIVLSVLLCTCGRAPDVNPGRKQLATVLVDSLTYRYTVNGDTTLLMGFDLREAPIEVDALTPWVDRIEGSGGNLLIVSDSLADHPTFPEQQRRAAALGVVLSRPGGLPCSIAGTASQFARSLLTGRGCVAYTGLDQGRLNSIRAARTVERHLRFRDLYSPQNGSDRWSARRDERGTYVYYMPGRGTVDVVLDEDEQIPRRVTVVGHLGTQRSEVLRPPYRRNFTLQSNEDRGGYLLIEALDR